MEIKDLSSKQHKELVSISPLLCQLGYIENADMFSDKPDICLPSKNNRQIGIEVTEYTYSKDEESISVVHRLLQDYVNGEPSLVHWNNGPWTTTFSISGKKMTTTEGNGIVWTKK